MTELICYFKFGLDGTGSFSSFMQKDENGHVPDGSTLMASQLVLLKVIKTKFLLFAAIQVLIYFVVLDMPGENFKLCTMIALGGKC